MYNIDEIKYLSTERGLNDRQIAEIMKCKRETITRIRNRNNIPKCNLDNREDKTFICGICSKKIFIKRKDSLKYLCDNCCKNINVKGISVFEQI